MPDTTTDPFDIGEALTPEQCLADLDERIRHTHGSNHDAGFQGAAVLSEEELIIVTELLGHLGAALGSEAAIEAGFDQRMPTLASAMASRIYSRLGI